MPAKSKKQQKFFGMVHKCQKTGDCASPEVEKVSKSIKADDAEDFARTKHKGLPEKKRKKKKMKTFKEWLAERDNRTDEVSTTTGDVACFKGRLPIGTTYRALREFPPKIVLDIDDDKKRRR